jgi:hypothetical protein
VRYQHDDGALIPEQLVLRRWKDRSKEKSAIKSGISFDGIRLPPGTWRALQNWLENGLRINDVDDPEVLKAFAERSRTKEPTLGFPTPTKFAQMLSFLQHKGVLRDVVHRDREPTNPGLPDLFLYRVDRQGGVHGGRFVEVKRWNRREKFKERVSESQKRELAFLAGLDLPAQVVYLLE